MKHKMTVEMAEELGLIPKINIYRRGSLTVRLVSNDIYSHRLDQRNKKYGVDENDMVEVEWPQQDGGK